MIIRFGPYSLDHANRMLSGPDGPIEVSGRSFDILTLLLAKPDAVISKNDLFDNVWPGITVGENTLQVHISALRRSLGANVIATVHGRGYKYCGPAPVEAATEGGKSDLRPHRLTEQSHSSTKQPVIAVLPFTNMSGDPSQDYFSDGITEDIITEISRCRPLTVIARHSSFCFKGSALNIKDVGAALGATFLVEGSIRKLGDNIRLTAQLLDAATAQQIWAQRYDRPLRDIFTLQDELVSRVVSSLVGYVERYGVSNAQSRVTENLDAYDCWLRANHSVELWTTDGNMASHQLLQEAVKKDPMFARAHASLAFSYIRQATFKPGSTEIPELESAGLRSAKHAVRLDPFDARTHNAIAWSYMYFRDFDRANAAFLKAASLNPNDGSNCLDRALAFAFLGDHKASEVAADHAVTLNPIPGEWFSTVQAVVHFLLRRHDVAEQHFALAPRNQPDILMWNAANSVYLKRHDEASEIMKVAFDILRQQWCGTKPMTGDDFISWFRHTNMLRRSEDWKYLYDAIDETGFSLV